MLVFVAVAAASVLLLMVLTLDTGKVFLARNQLQTAADNAARAALHAAYDADLPTIQSRDAGRSAAQRVAAGSSVIAGGVRLPNTGLRYGSYDFARGIFTDEPAGTGATGKPQRPGAVRVRLERSATTGAPIQGFLDAIPVVAEATASLRCRQISLVIDLSSSFQREIRYVKDSLADVSKTFLQGASRGDKMAVVTFSGEGTELYGETQALELKGLTSVTSAQIKKDVDGKTRSMKTCNSQKCQGTNTAAGLKLAREQLQQNPNDTCPGDDLIVLVSDGVPCDPDENRDEGRRKSMILAQQTVAEADAIEAAGMSLTSIFVNKDQETCPYGGAARGDAAFMASLVRGELGQALTDRPEEVARLLSASVGTFPIVMVH